MRQEYGTFRQWRWNTSSNACDREQISTHTRSRATPGPWSGPFRLLSNSHQTETKMKYEVGSIPSS